MEKHQHQRSNADPMPPTENHVRMSRHRMVERIFVALAAAVPSTVALLFFWHKFYQ